MLSPKELREKSALWGIPIESVDKDWILGHLLRLIFISDFKKVLVFKGGTCLRKIYFPDYRFSEDLDFTAIVEIKKGEIKRLLDSSLPSLYESTGIQFGKIKLDEKRYQDRLMGYEALIPFWGAAHPAYRQIPAESRWHTRIKLDISLREEMCLPVRERPLLHPYTDLPMSDIQIPVYSLEEIFAEKWRSLIQRSYFAPRDCYDLWYLWIHCKDSIDWIKVKETFFRKCVLKDISIDKNTRFLSASRIFNMKAQWIPSMENQLKELPSVEDVIKTLEEAVSIIIS